MKKQISVWPGKEVMVFNTRLWQLNGGDSETDTFMRKAVILKIYLEFNKLDLTSYISSRQYRKPELLADIRFENSDQLLSKGHFVNMMEEI